jgi:hypothetical protein
LELNSREIAILIWAAIGLVACLFSKNIRRALAGVVRAFFQRQIITVVSLLYIYLALEVGFLQIIGLWNWDQLKNALVLSVAVGFVSILQLNKIGDNPKFYRQWIVDNIQIVAIIEFVAVFYTFPLIVELILIPILTLIGGMIAVGERNENHKPVVNLLNSLLAIFGLFLIGHALYAIIAYPASFWTSQTLRDLYTPIVLSFLLLPFIQVIHLYSAYERVFVLLKINMPDGNLRRYAKGRALLAFGPSVTLLNRWNRHIATHRPTDKQAIDDSIQEVLDARVRERQPPDVVPADGWSPNVAKEFLHEDGLVTGDYHRQFDEWYAASPYLEIGASLLPNNIAYYVEGDKEIAKRLKLVLNVNSPDDAENSKLRFWQLAQSLTQKAIGDHALPDGESDFEIRIEDRRIILSRTNWTGGIPNGFTLKFCIEPV